MFTLTKCFILVKNIMFSCSLFLYFTETYHEIGYSQGFSSYIIKLCCGRDYFRIAFINYIIFNSARRERIFFVKVYKKPLNKKAT